MCMCPWGRVQGHALQRMSAAAASTLHHPPPPPPPGVNKKQVRKFSMSVHVAAMFLVATQVHSARLVAAASLACVL